MRRFIVNLLLLTMVAACSGRNESLPILGRKEIKNVTFEGKIKADTIYHTIRDFSFTNQYGENVTQETFRDKIYVADFFFTTCPTICPIMKTQMLRVYEKYKDNPEFGILSHTLDPKHDSVSVLYDFSDRLGVTGDTWHFVTGDMADIYDIGQNSYMVTAREDPDEPGGILHSGAFLLVDKQRRIRGIYDGTKEDKVDMLILDIERLLKEYRKG
jgi:protein SCO1/2